MHLLRGRREFVLGASGHIAGVINPPSTNRRHYWTNPKRPRSAEDWLAGALRHDGSWWPHWGRWLLRHAGRPRPAPGRLGSDAHPELEPAPGRYVRERIA
jgi:polyhydroxyalkanoate synthase